MYNMYVYKIPIRILTKNHNMNFALSFWMYQNAWTFLKELQHEFRIVTLKS